MSNKLPEVIRNSEAFMEILKANGIVDGSGNYTNEELHEFVNGLLHDEVYFITLENEEFLEKWYEENLRNLSWNDERYDSLWKEYRNIRSKFENEFTEKYNIDYEHIEKVGGGEGDGESVYGVFRLGNEYFRADWQYYSHYGYSDDYDDNSHNLIYKVVPKERVVTVYE